MRDLGKWRSLFRRFAISSARCLRLGGRRRRAWSFSAPVAAPCFSRRSWTSVQRNSRALKAGCSRRTCPAIFEKHPHPNFGRSDTSGYPMRRSRAWGFSAPEGAPSFMRGTECFSVPEKRGRLKRCASAPSASRWFVSGSAGLSAIAAATLWATCSPVSLAFC